MTDLQPIAIAIAAVAALIFAAVYYTVLAEQRAWVSPAAAKIGRPPAWLMGLELLRPS